MRAQQAANARFAATRALELPPVTHESLQGSRQNGLKAQGVQRGAAEDSSSAKCSSENCSFFFDESRDEAKEQRASGKAVVEGTSGALEEAKSKREEMLATVCSIHVNQWERKLFQTTPCSFRVHLDTHEVLV